MSIVKELGHTVYVVGRQCKTCGGYCCRHMSGHYHPKQFKDKTFEGLKAEIDKGHIAIDWWESCELGDQYFLRARHINAPVVDPSWEGRCVHLTNIGCGLPREERPLGCKTLKPRKTSSESCVPAYTKEDCKRDWSPWNKILGILVSYYSYNPLPIIKREVCRDENGKLIESFRVGCSSNDFKVTPAINMDVDITRELRLLGLEDKYK